MTNDLQIYSRANGIIDSLQLREFPVTVIGVGAIGSTLVRLLSQLGFCQFSLYDGDTVEAENLGVQFYRKDDVGRPKVEACRENIRHFLPHVNIVTHDCAYVDQSLDGLVVAGVDSMQARLTIWQAIQHQAANIPLYIDGRTAGEEVHVYTVRPLYPSDIVFYENSIVPDERATQMPCGQQGAPHAQAVIAGLIGAQIVRWFREELVYPLVCMNLRMMHMTAVSSKEE